MRVRPCGVVFGVAAFTVAWVGPAGSSQAQIQETLQAPRAVPPLPQVPPVRPFQPQQPRPLFPVPPTEQPRAPNQAVTATKPRVVCGMTLIPVDPKVDPKIALKGDPENKDDGTKYTIRAVQPSICW